MATFDCLVVVDFATTPAEQREIVEFPWVVYDLQSKRVLDAKRILCKPEREFEGTIETGDKATTMTNISLVAAKSLQDAISEFNAYAYSNFTAQVCCAMLSRRMWAAYPYTLNRIPYLPPVASEL